MESLSIFGPNMDKIEAGVGQGNLFFPVRQGKQPAGFVRFEPIGGIVYKGEDQIELEGMCNGRASVVKYNVLTLQGILEPPL